MKINDVEKITGLTSKAIRLYESKGLINVKRDKNGYRNYSDDDVSVLKNIKILRSVDVSISDIKLYLYGVVSINELMDKRKTEIMNESGQNSEKYLLCEKLSQSNSLENFHQIESFNEYEETEKKNYGDVSVGIDIGTTTVSAVIYDINSREQVESFCAPHNSYVYSDFRSEQDVSVIMEKTEKLLYRILDSYKNVVSIGVTGQMHGIVYVDKEGNAVSNLINWQDKRGDKTLADGKTVCQRIFDITEETVSTGYGICTHYYNVLSGEVPKNATSFVSIMDYFVMKICGLEKTKVHSSVASSFGFFDVRKNEFMKDKLSLLGIDESFLPSVTGESIVVGKLRETPVSIAIGDNQASFLGSVSENNDSVLINIGTGSQISAVSEYCEVSGDIEIRPLIEGKYLICASALCGGYAYSMVESFFRSYILSIGMENISQYKVINGLAKTAYENGEGGLDIDVSFFGKRSNPNLRGSIKRIDSQNFTPSNLVLGVLKGMCNELYELYGLFPQKKNKAVASGGTVKKNEVLKSLIGDTFNMSVYTSKVGEETATGVSLFAAFVTKKIEYNDGFGRYIKYHGSDL